MEESHGKGPASHPDPESCVGIREDAGEALTGAHAGQPLSCEITRSGVPTPLCEAEGHTTGGNKGEPSVDPAQSKTLCMRGNSSRGNREIPPTPGEDGASGRPEKVVDRTSGTYEGGKSDGCIVPEKSPNALDENAGGGDGGKATGQRECGSTRHALDTGRGSDCRRRSKRSSWNCSKTAGTSTTS